MRDHVSSITECAGTIEVLVLRCNSITATESAFLPYQRQPLPSILVGDDLQPRRNDGKVRIGTEQTSAEVGIAESAHDCLSGLFDGNDDRSIPVREENTNGADDYPNEAEGQSSRSGAQGVGLGHDRSTIWTVQTCSQHSPEQGRGGSFSVICVQ